MGTANLIYIADVFCPWCYAFGPIMKRIADEHPEFPVTVYGGNLMANPVSLRDEAISDPGLGEFWREVEQTSGRDLGGAIAALGAGKDMQLYSPGADMILAALKKLAPGHELEQLLLLEDMFYGQGQDLFSDTAIEQIAERWKLDPNELARTCNSPENKDATAQALSEASALMGEINSYPTIFLTRGDRRDAVSRGYVAYETVAQRLLDAMQDLGVDTAHDQYCTWHGGCSLRGRRK